MESFKAPLTTKFFFLKYLRRVLQDDRGCWVWQGSLNSRGYAHAKAHGTYWLIHRYVYAHLHGPIPHGMVIRHTCDNRACINPDHLLVGTPQENVYDQMERGRFKPFRGQCKPVEYYRSIRNDRSS